MSTPSLVYFSSTSNNTHRFVEKLGIPAARIPVLAAEPPLMAERPFVLVLPTYGGGNLDKLRRSKGAVPKQVIKFLNIESNRDLLRGVIAAGNTNFADSYCLAGDIIAAKTGAPVLYRVEVFGTPEDIDKVCEGLDAFWARLATSPA